jgi:glycosyl transferase, family 25
MQVLSISDNPFSQLNSYFDKIYVITLKRATDRHKMIEEGLAGLNYEFFFGVDKDDLNIAALDDGERYDSKKAILNSRYSKPMTPGQIGCAYSHVNVYKDIINNNFGKTLILEDDVIVDLEKTGSFSSIVQELPVNWDLLYLGYSSKNMLPFMRKLKQFTYHIQHAVGLLAWDHKQIKNLFPRKYSTHLQTAGYHDCTHAYCLTQQGAKILLNEQTPICFVADNLLGHCISKKMLNAFISRDKLFNQDWQVSAVRSKSYLNS